MSRIIDVMTGEVAVGREGDIFRSSAIGSCVVISAYCPKTKTGGLAHVMLSGFSPHEDSSRKTRYAGNAINDLLKQMISLGADIGNLDVCLVGAGNVLKRLEDTTAKNNLDSITEILREKKIRIRAESVGGTTRRSVTFDIAHATVFYTTGDEEERLLWASRERSLLDWISELEESKSIIRKREKALRESEYKYRQLHESMLEGFVSVNMQGQIQQVNRTFEEMVGYSFEELQKMTYTDLTPVKWHAIEAKIVNEQILPRGYSDIYEKEYTRKDGTVFSVELRTFLIRDGENAPLSMWAIVRDITERKRTQDALQESEVKHRLLFDLAGDAIFIHDEQAQMLAVNLVACQRLGYTHQELMALTIPQIDSPDEARHAPERIARLMEKGHHEFETVHRRKDGLLINVEVSSTRITWDGQPAMMSIVRDVTERKRVEEKYSMLFKSMPDACAVHEIICDDARRPVDYRFLVVNPAFERMTGLKAENVVGRTVLEALPNTERFWIETYGQVALSGDPVRFENYSSELQKYFDVAAFRNAPNEFVTVFTDITERKQTEEKLAHLHGLHSRLLDKAPALIWRSGIDAKCDWFNATWLGFTGRTLEQEQGDGWVEGVHPEDLERCVKIYLKAFHAREPFVMEYRLRRHDGEFRWITDHGIPFNSVQGEFLGYIGYCFDITDARKSEEELRQRARELKVFYDSSIGREERILELKKEVDKLKRELGK
ncbi:MAG: PAS domain S-box protein [Candidatus Omnitrophica bacterium]|nr:PAS domain S-box protein [Candidatus Omnitrophota bacterium]